MGQSYVVTSGKGGVGKTIAAFNIGVGLALKDKNVVLIDGDLGLPNLDKIAAIEDHIEAAIRLNDFKRDLRSLIIDDYLVSHMLIRDKRYPNLYFIPAQFLRYDCWKFPGYMKKLVWLLKERFDYVLIDSPSGIDCNFDNAVNAADKAIIITTPEIISIRDADTVIGRLDDCGIHDHMLIINRMSMNPLKNIDTLDIEDILSILSTRLIGIIPEDENIIVSAKDRTLIVNNEKNKTGQAYRNIVGRILGEQIEFLSWSSEKTYLGKTIDRLSGLVINYFSMSREIHI